MTVKFYFYNGDRKKIKKFQQWSEITPEGGINCNIKEPCNIIEPVLIVQRSRLGENWAKVNYCYIKELGRYYFIDKPNMLTHDQYELPMTVDPLMSYYDELMNTNFEISRSESVNSTYFIDSEKLILSKREISDGDGAYQFGMFPEDSTGNKYIMTVAGG